MSDNSFTILGISSGMPRAGRACSGYVLQTGDELSLIDCGGGVSSTFSANGFNPLKVEQIFISHTHPDHVSDLPLFIQMIYLAGRKEPLAIFLPEEFVLPFENYLKAVYLIREKIPFELKIIGFRDGFTFKKSFKLKAIGNNHLQGYAPFIDKYHLSNKMQSHSFEIEISGKKLLYSADILNFDDIKDLIDRQDFVIIEATHLDFNRFIDFVPQVHVGQYIISHLGSIDEIEHIVETIKESNLTNIVLAKEGLKVEF